MTHKPHVKYSSPKERYVDFINGQIDNVFYQADNNDLSDALERFVRTNPTIKQLESLSEIMFSLWYTERYEGRPTPIIEHNTPIKGLLDFIVDRLPILTEALNHMRIPASNKQAFICLLEKAETFHRKQAAQEAAEETRE